MPEGQVVNKTKTLATVKSLQTDFEALGIKEGMVLLVHSSLSAVGWVCGGPVAVIIALQKVLGETGTLVMPAHSADLSDPSQWEKPPVPESWWQTIREDDACLRSRFDAYSFDGYNCRNIPKGYRRFFGVHIHNIPFVQSVREHHVSSITIPWRMVWVSTPRLPRSMIYKVSFSFLV